MEPKSYIQALAIKEGREKSSLFPMSLMDGISFSFFLFFLLNYGVQYFSGCSAGQ